MINLNGKTVYTELSELVDPPHTALLLIDMAEIWTHNPFPARVMSTVPTESTEPGQR